MIKIIALFFLIHGLAFSDQNFNIIAVVLNEGPEQFGKIESEYLKKGIDLALDELSKQFKKENISVKFYNDHGRVDDALKLGKQLALDDNIKVVISGYSSKTAVPLASVLKGKRLIGAYASSPESISDPISHARLVSGNLEQGAVMYDFAKKKYSIKKACLIIESDDGFSLYVKRGILNVVKSASEIMDYSYVGDNEIQITEIIDKCVKNAPDVIFHSGRSASARLLLAAFLKNNSKIPVVGSDGWGDSPLVISSGNSERLKSSSSKLYITYHWNGVPTNHIQRKFIDRSKKKYNEEPDALMALGHDSVVFANALILGGKSDKEPLETILQTLPVKNDLILFSKNKNRILPLKHMIYRFNHDGTLTEVKL